MLFANIHGKKIDLTDDFTSYVEKVVSIATNIKKEFGAEFKKFGNPKFVIILGTSGPKHLLKRLVVKKIVEYSQLGFPISKAKGHAQNEKMGDLKQKFIMAF